MFMKTLTDGNCPEKKLLMTAIKGYTYYLLPVFILTFSPFPAFADPSPESADGWHMMGWGYGHEFGFMHGLFGILWMILIFGGLIALIIFAVRGLRITHTDDTSSTSEMTPLEILKERYARGEIDHEEFEDRKKRLLQ